jgi:hypothetical protein
MHCKGLSRGLFLWWLIISDGWSCAAILGLVGTQMLWVGAYDLLSEEPLTWRWNEEQMGWSFFPGQMRVFVLYIVVGMIILVLMDSLYSNCGMDTKLNPREGLVPRFMRWWDRRQYKQPDRAIRGGLRATIAFVGMMLTWTGWYRLLDDICEATLLRDTLYQVAGVVLLLLTQTTYHMALIFPPETETRRTLRNAGYLGGRCSVAGCSEFLAECVPHEWKSFLRASISLGAQNLLWVGSYNVQLHFPGDKFTMNEMFWRVFFLAIAGLVGMIATASVWDNAFLDFEEPVPVRHCGGNFIVVAFFFLSNFCCCCCCCWL